MIRHKSKSQAAASTLEDGQEGRYEREKASKLAASRMNARSRGATRSLASKFENGGPYQNRASAEREYFTTLPGARSHSGCCTIPSYISSGLSKEDLAIPSPIRGMVS